MRPPSPAHAPLLLLLLASNQIIRVHPILQTRHLQSLCNASRLEQAHPYPSLLCVCDALPLDERIRLLAGDDGVAPRHITHSAGASAGPRSPDTDLALLFVLGDRLLTEDVWRAWLQGRSGRAALEAGRVHVFIHFSSAGAAEAVRAGRASPPLSEFSPTVVSTKPTSHGNVIAAMNELLRRALQGHPNSSGGGHGLTQRFLFASESCIPVKPLAQVLAWSGQQPHAWFTLSRPPVALADHGRWLVMQGHGVPAAAVAKSVLWTLLNRRTAQLLVELEPWYAGLLPVADGAVVLSMNDEYMYVTAVLTAELVRRAGPLERCAAASAAAAVSGTVTTDGSGLGGASSEGEDHLCAVQRAVAAAQGAHAVESAVVASGARGHNSSSGNSSSGHLATLTLNGISELRVPFILRDQVRFLSTGPRQLPPLQQMVTYNDWGWLGASAAKAEGRPFSFASITLPHLAELVGSLPFPLLARKFSGQTAVTVPEAVIVAAEAEAARMGAGCCWDDVAQTGQGGGCIPSEAIGTDGEAHGSSGCAAASSGGTINPQRLLSRCGAHAEDGAKPGGCILSLVEALFVTGVVEAETGQ